MLKSIRSIRVPRWNLHVDSCSIYRCCSTSSETYFPPIDISAQEFPVLILKDNGDSLTKQTSLKELKSIRSLYARDIIALDLDVVHKHYEGRNKNRKKYSREKPPWLLLPRANTIVASFGKVKLLLFKDHLMLLDPQSPVSAAWSEDFKRALSTRLHNMSFSNEDKDTPFELFVLEDLLHRACDGIDHRVSLFSALVEKLIKDLESKQLDESNMHTLQLNPVSELLYDLELENRDAQKCLLDVLAADEDMEALQLSQKANALGNMLDGTSSNLGMRSEAHISHDEVELMLENYALRLASSLHEVLLLQRRISTRLSEIELSIKVQRNRMIWVNVRLGTGGICVAICALVAGLFGMNLPSGLEDSKAAFFLVSGGAGCLSAAVYVSTMKYMRENVFDAGSQGALVHKENKVIRDIFSDVRPLEVTLRKARKMILTASDQNVDLDKTQFARLYATAKNVEKPCQEEVDLLFALIDTDGDGAIEISEIKSLIMDGYVALGEEEHQQTNETK